MKAGLRHSRYLQSLTYALSEHSVSLCQPLVLKRFRGAAEERRESVCGLVVHDSRLRQHMTRRLHFFWMSGELWPPNGTPNGNCHGAF